MVSANEVETVPIGPALETAIQRSPMLYIRNGYAYRFKSFHRDAIMTRWIFFLLIFSELSKGIGRFRELLRAVEARGFISLRQVRE